MIYFIILINLLLYNAEIINNQPLSINRAYLASASLPIQGLAFFAGGRDIIEVVNKVDIFNSNTNQWIQSSLTIARQQLTGTSLGNYGLVFFAGGCDFRCTTNYDTIDIFNYSSNKWTTQKLSIARNSLSSAFDNKNNMVFFGGGYNSFSVIDVVDIYDAKSSQWTTSKLTAPRFNIASTGISLLGLVFFGAGENQYTVFNNVDIYVTSQNYWLLYNLTIPRSQCASTSLPQAGLVFFAGGRDVSDQELNSIEIFDAINFVFYQAFLSSPRKSLLAGSIPNMNIVFFISGFYLEYNVLPIYSPVIDYINFNNDTSSSFSISFGYANSAISILPYQNLIVIAGGENGKDTNFLNQVNFYGSCNLGQYQTINPLQCNPCPPGFACPYGNTAPLICPKGYYCPSNNPKIIPCPAGTYNNNVGALVVQQCTKCPLGTYNTFSGQPSIDFCLPCFSGTFCKTGSVFPKDCPFNYYCPDTQTQIACPPGTYTESQDNTDISACLACPAGSYCSGNGNYITPCNPGTYADNNGSAYCKSCPIGHYCPFATVTPSICPQDSIALQGAPACSPCQNGQYTNGPGTSICIQCLNGFWNVNSWWCQTVYEKLITLTIWFGTIFSVILTIVKLRYFIKKRIRKLNYFDIPISIKNIINIENLIKNKSNYPLLTRLTINDLENQYKNYDEEIRGLKETIFNLKMEIEDLK